MADGRLNALEYKQISILSLQGSEIEVYLRMLYDHFRDPTKGPLYAHCWNGWHASGLSAAYTLRQFCGFSADAAVDYWNLNTDGNNGPAYDSIRAKIRAFQPFPGMDLTPAERATHCPNAADLSF